MARKTRCPSSARMPSTISPLVDRRALLAGADSGARTNPRQAAETRKLAESSNMATGAVSSWTSEPPRPGPTTRTDLRRSRAPAAGRRRAARADEGGEVRAACDIGPGR